MALCAVVIGCKKGSSATERTAPTDASIADVPTAFSPDSGEAIACKSVCALRATELKCSHGDMCEDACAKLGQAKFCVKPVHAFVACFTKQPTSEWECNAEGMPVIGGHVCEGEQGSMSDCLMQTQGKL